MEDELTRKVIGLAIEVHRELGPGLLESSYEQCLMYELKENKIDAQFQVSLPIDYKGHALDAGYRLDILIPGQPKIYGTGIYLKRYLYSVNLFWCIN